jgi:hypothetical protein
MTYETNDQNSDQYQPHRPPMRGAQKYDVLREAEKATFVQLSELEPHREKLFTITLIATREKGVSMDDDNNFLIDLIFKPNEGKLRLRPQETQLLLAYYAELLKEIEEEENDLIRKDWTP